MGLSGQLAGVVKRALRRAGLDVQRYANTTGPMRQRVLSRAGVTVVFDVGANAGQFGEQLRRGGYEGRIVSFEPLPDAYQRLAGRAAADERWSCHQAALGAEAGALTLYEAGNSASSSLRPMLARHELAAPESAYVAEHEVEVVRLDDIARPLAAATDVSYLKIDVQGFEREVLEGAPELLARAAAVEVELSLVPLYEGQAPWLSVLAVLEEAGFHVAWLDRGLRDPETGELLQVDGILTR